MNLPTDGGGSSGSGSNGTKAIGGSDGGGVVRGTGTGASCPGPPRPPCILIEVCRGPDCTGLGGGIAVLEIEELVQEHNSGGATPSATTSASAGADTDTTPTGGAKLRVVDGGCRDLCSVGPNVHVLASHPSSGRRKRRTRRTLLESVHSVGDPGACLRALETAAAWGGASPGPCGGGSPPAAQAKASQVDKAFSVLARRTERARWEALRDVSRTIARCRRAAGQHDGSGPSARKLAAWKDSCRDRIERGPAGTTPRDQRRTRRLVAIASERLDRSCRGGESDSEESGDGDESDSVTSGDE